MTECGVPVAALAGWPNAAAGASEVAAMLPMKARLVALILLFMGFLPSRVIASYGAITFPPDTMPLLPTGKKEAWQLVWVWLEVQLLRIPIGYRVREDRQP